MDGAYIPIHMLCLMSVCLMYVLCVCLNCVLGRVCRVYIYCTCPCGQALITRHLVLRDEWSTCGHLGGECPVFTKATYSWVDISKRFVWCPGAPQKALFVAGSDGGGELSSVRRLHAGSV